MNSTLRTFMSGIIDYAGLFPPAALSLDEAIHLFSSYKADDDRWMISRFIIPASRLHELDAYAETLIKQQPPFHFSVIGRSGEHENDFIEHLKQDLEDMHRLHQVHSGCVSTRALEVKLPSQLISALDTTRWTSFFEQVASTVDEFAPEGLTVFYESIFNNEDWRNQNSCLLEALMLHRSQLDKALHPKYRGAGFKMRCGGVEAALFPSSEKVAFAISECARLNIPLKATAGLHHPFRHFNEGVQTHMFGFVNIFLASALAQAHALSEVEIEQICLDEAPSAFFFTDEEAGWKHLSISRDELETARKTYAVSFGSCSFDEPRDDLRSAGLL